MTICVGKPIIQTLAADGAWQAESGESLVAADELFRQDPYAEIEQLRADLDLRNQTALDRKKAIVELEAENARLTAVCKDKTILLRDAYAQTERLRAALKSLAKDPPATLDEPVIPDH